MCPAGEAEKRKLDSSVKRNTAVLKKLRQLSEDSSASILEDLHKVNQSKVHTLLLFAAVQSSSSSPCLALKLRRAQWSPAAATFLQCCVADRVTEVCCGGAVHERGCQGCGGGAPCAQRRPSCCSGLVRHSCMLESSVQNRS